MYVNLVNLALFPLTGTGSRKSRKNLMSGRTVMLQRKKNELLFLQWMENSQFCLSGRRINSFVAVEED